MTPSEMMHGLGHVYGMTRSLAMYYGIPFRRQRMLRFYNQLIRPGDLCFDIGSHVGNRIRGFLDLGARVVAVEPQPAFTTILRRLYGKNANVVIKEAGIGAATGTKTLYISSKTPTVTTFSKEWITTVQRDPSFADVVWDRQREVPIVTLDDLIGEHGVPAFCKIDVEGFEYEVLAGLTRPLPALSFEFIPVAGALAAQCLERLDSLGPYEYNWSMVETFSLKSPVWLDAPAMTRVLANMGERGRSGDVYARCKKS